MKKLIYKVSSGLLSLLCALGLFGGIIALAFSKINILLAICIIAVFMGLFLAVTVLGDDIEYEGMSMDERHELLRNRGYRYCPYCGEKLEDEE